MKTGVVSDTGLGPTPRPADTPHERAQGHLFEALYDELHRMAERELGRSDAATLTPTTLLHETYLNISQRDSLAFPDRGRFLFYAGRTMRGLMIDHVRKRRAQKRGGGSPVTVLPEDLPELDDIEAARIEELNDALESLAQFDTRLAECVDLKFFGGLSFNEIARLRDVSERTVQRDWDKARVLLNRLIKDRTIPESAE